MLAERTGGVIINADSAQIYRDLPILSAAPPAAERSRAEHRLYGIRDGTDPCSAADWARLARAEISELHGSGRLPILVGGTGLYLRILLNGIAPVPPIAEDVRRHVRNRAVEENYRQLLELDPGAAGRLNPTDTTRVGRALEVVLATGTTLAQWQGRSEGGIAPLVELSATVLLPPRRWLYERCNMRFEAMVAGGAVEEAQRLLKRGLDPRLPVMRAIGVREVAAFLAGDLSREEMIANGQQATRNYAKRQYTWFAHQSPPEWRRFTDIASPVPAELFEALSFPGQ